MFVSFLLEFTLFFFFFFFFLFFFWVFLFPTEREVGVYGRLYIPIKMLDGRFERIHIGKIYMFFFLFTQHVFVCLNFFFFFFYNIRVESRYISLSEDIYNHVSSYSFT
jgi:hypothetical protein